MTYKTRAAFNAAAPGLPVEDFEEGRFSGVLPGLTEFPGPLTEAGAISRRGDVVFQPGEILPGLTIEARFFTDQEFFTDLVLLGPPFFGTSKSITPNISGATLDLSFDPGVKAVGLDLPQNFDSSSSVKISVFGLAGLLATFSDTTGTFFGVTSDMELITGLNIEASNFGSEIVDNVAFGNPVPEPSMLSALALMFVGGLGVRIRSNRHLAKC